VQRSAYNVPGELGTAPAVNGSRNDSSPVDATDRAFRTPDTLVDEVVRVLTLRIVRGELAPGTRLIEEHLAQEFGISRPPIRESFRILQREGLVVITPRRGVRVREITAAEVEQVYVCRSTLEGLSARLATPRMTPESLARFHELIHSMRSAVDEQDVERYLRDNVDFHELVGLISGNEPLRALIRTLGTQVLRLRFTSLSMSGRLQYSLRMHERIVNAFQRGDAAEAEAATRELIDAAAHALITRFSLEPTSAQA
jgi:DNA-binding GntR family transcriptional regulator